MQQKGFTLIELLIVIAIIAVLSVVVVLTLNPAELLRQARDSTRISDMSSINSAVNLFLADGGVFTNAIGCYAHSSSTAVGCGPSSSTVGMGFATTSGGASLPSVLTALVTTSSRSNAGTGWIPVNFTTISAGAPFGILPVDPTNNPTYFYAFAIGGSSTYKLNARMESTKYKFQGGGDVVSNDGEDATKNQANNTTTYAVGNKMDL